MADLWRNWSNLESWKSKSISALIHIGVLAQPPTASQGDAKRQRTTVLLGKKMAVVPSFVRNFIAYLVVVAMGLQIELESDVLKKE